MADKRPSLITRVETALRGWVHTDDPTLGSGRFDLGSLNGMLATRAERDALFFGRGQSGSHAVWTSPEHGIIGTNDFTLVLPVVDWWYSTSSNTGLWLANNANDGNYATGTAHNALRVYFPTSGQVVIALHDASPNAETASRAYVVAKAALYDVAANRPGVLIIRRSAGVWSLRLNTQAITLPAETVTGSPVSTWAGYMDTTYHRLGQVFSGSGYLGKLGVPLIYTCGLSDAECDQLVTQGPRSLPYRHGSFKNYAPTAGTTGWAATGGIVVSTYDLATDPDGIGLPPGAAPGDYCVKITRTAQPASAATAFCTGVFRQGGPVWLATATVKLTAISGGANVTWGANDGSLIAGLPPTGQINQVGVGVAVADGWKAVGYVAQFVGSSNANSGPSLTAVSATNTDFVAYIHKPVARPLGLLFDGVVQPCRVVDDAGPNGIVGRLVNRVDPITDRRDWRIPATVDMTTTGNKQLLGGELLLNPERNAITTIDTECAGAPTFSIGDGTTATRYTPSAAHTAGRTRETLSNPFPADSGKTSLYANVTTAHASSTAEKIVIRGNRNP